MKRIILAVGLVAALAACAKKTPPPENAGQQGGQATTQSPCQGKAPCGAGAPACNPPEKKGW